MTLILWGIAIFLTPSILAVLWLVWHTSGQSQRPPMTRERPVPIQGLATRTDGLRRRLPPKVKTRSTPERA